MGAGAVRFDFAAFVTEGRSVLIPEHHVMRDLLNRAAVLGEELADSQAVGWLVLDVSFIQREKQISGFHLFVGCVLWFSKWL